MKSVVRTAVDPRGDRVSTANRYVHGDPGNPTVFSKDDHEDTIYKLLLQTQLEQRRMQRKLFDYSNPVDESLSQAGAMDPAHLTFDIQRDYDLPERYTSIYYSLPVGITSAILQLGGTRFFTLYSGAATATQIVNSLPGLGVIVGPDERRIITFTGTPTSGFYIGLSGHCLEREGNR